MPTPPKSMRPRGAVPYRVPPSIRESDAAMTLAEFRREMDQYWGSVDNEALEMKDSYLALDRLHSLYRRLDDAERALADQVLSEWVLSDTEAKRFDAMAVIGEFRVRRAVINRGVRPWTWWSSPPGSMVDVFARWRTMWRVSAPAGFLRSRGSTPRCGHSAAEPAARGQLAQQSFDLLLLEGRTGLVAFLQSTREAPGGDSGAGQPPRSPMHSSGRGRGDV